MLLLLAGTRNELILLLLHLELVLMLLHCGCLILQHKAADAADVLLLQMQQEHDMLQLVPPMYHALLQLHKYYRHSLLKMKSKYISIGMAALRMAARGISAVRLRERLRRAMSHCRRALSSELICFELGCHNDKRRSSRQSSIVASIVDRRSGVFMLYVTCVLHCNCICKNTHNALINVLLCFLLLCDFPHDDRRHPTFACGGRIQ